MYSSPNEVHGELHKMEEETRLLDHSDGEEDDSHRL